MPRVSQLAQFCPPSPPPSNSLDQDPNKALIISWLKVCSFSPGRWAQWLEHRPSIEVSQVRFPAPVRCFSLSSLSSPLHPSLSLSNSQWEEHAPVRINTHRKCAFTQQAPDQSLLPLPSLRSMNLSTSTWSHCSPSSEGHDLGPPRPCACHTTCTESWSIQRALEHMINWPFPLINEENNEQLSEIKWKIKCFKCN